MNKPDALITNSVACEACRTKKCKCDRTLPTCTQCSKQNATCIYPQSHKRGFPEGYLAGLEQRLLQTEIALFETLSSSVLGQGSSVPQNLSELFEKRDARQSKAARIEEWRRLPLNTPEQQQQWWETNAKELDIEYTTPSEGLHGYIIPITTSTPNEMHADIISPRQPPSSTSTEQSSPLTSRQTQNTWWQEQSDLGSVRVQQAVTSPQITRHESVSTEPLSSTTRAQQLSLSQSRRFF